jgi:hypothetical protein
MNFTELWVQSAPYVHPKNALAIHLAGAFFIRIVPEEKTDAKRG